MLRKLASPAWAILEYGWYPLLLFIATPWFLYRLGTEQYGHWMLLTATVGFGAVLSTGTGAATTKAVSAGIGRAGSDPECTVRASLAIALIGGSALVLLVLAVFWLAGGSWFGRMGDPALVWLTGVAAALLIWLEQIDNVFSSAIKGAEQFGPAARVEVVSKTAQVLVAAIVLLKWTELPALYTALLLVAVTRLFAKAIIARRLLGLSNLRPSLTGVPEILYFAKWGWLQGIGGVLFGVADRLLVGSLLGATSLAYYSIASQLALQVHAITVAGVSVVLPTLSRKLANGRPFSLQRVAKLVMAANFALCTALASTLLIFGRDLLNFWLGFGTAQYVISILPYLVFAYWLIALNATPHYLLLSLGRFRFVAASNLVAGFLLILAISAVVTAYGLEGVAAARILYGGVILINFAPVLVHLRKPQL